jgi:hypothetical protein
MSSIHHVPFLLTRTPYASSSINGEQATHGYIKKTKARSCDRKGKISTECELVIKKGRITIKENQGGINERNGEKLKKMRAKSAKSTVAGMLRPSMMVPC